MSECPSYPKIETLFERDEKFHVDTARLRCPEFRLIKSWLVTEMIDGTNIRVSLEPIVNREVLVEMAAAVGDTLPIDKLWEMKFRGRTDKAEIPIFLLAHLRDTFTLDRMQRLWRGKKDCQLCKGKGGDFGLHGCTCVEPYPITLYGEGYGARIQKGGGNYREGVSFRLFDVLMDGKWWLDRSANIDIAKRLDIEIVPCVPLTYYSSTGRITPHGSIEAIVELVEHGFRSVVARKEQGEDSQHMAEGIVARTDPYLFDKHGRPLRFKLKTKDFAPGEEGR